MSQISWDPDRYREVNRHPVNQVAKRLLEDTEAEKVRAPMYAHQLMRWGMKQNPEAYDQTLLPRVRTFLDETELAWTPQKQLEFLLKPPGPGDASEEDAQMDLVSAEDLALMAPEEAAETLLEILHENLMEVDVTYPWSHSQDLDLNLSDPQEMEEQMDVLMRRLHDASSG